MKKFIVYLMAVFLLVPLVASANLGPLKAHKVLVLGPSGSNFMKTDGQGYSMESVVWLLNRLGFRLTIWQVNSVTHFSGADTSGVGPLGKYDAIFLCDVGTNSGSTETTMRNVRNAAAKEGVKLYILGLLNDQLGSEGSAWNSGASRQGVDVVPPVDTFLAYAPGDNACPLTMSGFGTTDTLLMHWVVTNSYNFQLEHVPQDSVDAGLVTRLIWDIDHPDTCLMWRYQNGAINMTLMSIATPPVGPWLIVSQFVRDMAYVKYRDYVPLCTFYHLDADNMDYPCGTDNTTCGYCGGDTVTSKWIRIAEEVRRIGWTNFYVSVWSDAFNSHCQNLIAAWPYIKDVIRISSIHGPDEYMVPGTPAGHRDWSAIANVDSLQWAYSTMWPVVRGKFSGVDSTTEIIEHHDDAWSLNVVKLEAKHGLKVLGAYQTLEGSSGQAPNTYITKKRTCMFMRFRPFSPPPSNATLAAKRDSLAWVQVMPSGCGQGNDTLFVRDGATLGWTDYGGSTTHQGATGRWLWAFVEGLQEGQFPLTHFTQLHHDNVLAECTLRAVIAPFMKATKELWEFDNTPDNIRKLATTNPIEAGWN